MTCVAMAVFPEIDRDNHPDTVYGQLKVYFQQAGTTPKCGGPKSVQNTGVLKAERPHLSVSHLANAAGSEEASQTV